MICMEVDGMKRVLFKVILPLAFVAVWLNMCYWICLGENGVNWFQFWIMSGFPFSIQKMLVLLIPRNFGIAGSIGVLALDAVIGGMIGVIVLAIKIIAIIRESVQIRKEVHCAGGNNTKNDCPCNQDIQTDRKCSPEGDEDVSGASET